MVIEIYNQNTHRDFPVRFAFKTFSRARELSSKPLAKTNCRTLSDFPGPTEVSKNEI